MPSKASAAKTSALGLSMLSFRSCAVINPLRMYFHLPCLSWRCYDMFLEVQEGITENEERKERAQAMHKGVRRQSLWKRRPAREGHWGAGSSQKDRENLPEDKNAITFLSPYTNLKMFILTQSTWFLKTQILMEMDHNKLRIKSYGELVYKLQLCGYFFNSPWW